MAKKAKKKLDYSAALEELTGIRDAMENGEVPVDELSESVKRAQELVKICREQLRTTEAEIEQILEEEGSSRQEGEA